MKTSIFLAGLAGVLILTSGSVMAQGHRDRPDLAAMDTDGDGAVSQAEMTAFAQMRAAERAARMFTRLDADADGLISAAEFEAAKERRSDRPQRPTGD